MTSEDELWIGHRERETDVTRIVRCACGGTLEAPANDQAMLALAVERHRLSWAHRAWWQLVKDQWY